MKTILGIIIFFSVTGCRVDLDVKDINTKSSDNETSIEESAENIIQANLGCSAKSTGLSITAPYLDTQGNCSRPLSKSLLLENHNNPMVIRSNGDIVIGVSGNGFAISSDQGQNWRHITQVEGIAEFRFLEDLVEDQAGNVYICYDFGTYVTRDNFQSFQFLSNTAETNNCKSIHVTNSGTVIIGHKDYFSISNDNGLNFNHVSTGTSGSTFGVEKIRSDDENNIYAIAYDMGISAWHLLVSTNNGTSFNSNALSAYFPSTTVIPETLSINNDTEDLYIAFSDTGLQFSDNKGDSFTDINSFGHPTLSDISVGTSLTHLEILKDFSGFWAIAEEDYYFSSDPSTFGFTHIDFTQSTTGYSVKPLNIVTKGNNLYSIHTTGLYTYDSGSSSIIPISLIDPINQGTLPSSVQQFRSNSDDILISFDEYSGVKSHNIAYSKDGGKTFTYINSFDHFPAGFNGSTNEIKDIAILSDKSILIAVENAGLLKTSDDFQTFTIYDNSNSGSFPLDDALRVAANSTDQWLVGLSTGELFYTSNGGVSFNQVDTAISYTCPIAAGRLGIAKNGYLYAYCSDSGSKGVFGSTDGGTSWSFAGTDTVQGMMADPSSNRMYWNYLQDGLSFSDNGCASITTHKQASGIAPTALFSLSLGMAIDQNGKVYIGIGDLWNGVIEIYADNNGNGVFSRLYYTADGLPSQETEFIMSMGISGGDLHMITISRYLTTKLQ